MYAITNIQAEWSEIKESTTNSAWRKVWPEVNDDFTEFVKLWRRHGEGVA